ncbi:MAG: hypothetical protein ACI83P_001448 [Janthinobacterium sp.]|jgi:hypothetical protein
MSSGKVTVHWIKLRKIKDILRKIKDILDLKPDAGCRMPHCCIRKAPLRRASQQLSSPGISGWPLLST